MRAKGKGEGEDEGAGRGEGALRRRGWLTRASRPRIVFLVLVLVLFPDLVSVLALALSFDSVLVLVSAARAQVERDPSNADAYDMIAGTQRRSRSAASRGGSRDALAASSRDALAVNSGTTSPSLSPMEIEEPAPKSIRPADKVKSMFSSLFSGGRNSNNSGSGARGSSGRDDSVESRAPLNRPGSMNGARGAADDSDDVEERLAAVDFESLNMLSSASRSSAGARSSSSRPRRDFFSDL